MTQLGLVSVTFRGLDPERILALTAGAGLSGIEWGGDIHVPAGDLSRAKEVGARTRESGLQVFSYGSYYYAGESDPADFEAVLASAAALGAPIIRIWAGRRSASAADLDYFHRVVADARRVCDLAAKKEITVCFEYHPNTLTDDSLCACSLLREIARPNMQLYWQPNPDRALSENREELQRVLPHVVTVHAFQWTAERKRQPFEAGLEIWRQYRDILRAAPQMPRVLLEFVAEDSPEQFLADSAALRELFAE